MPWPAARLGRQRPGATRQAAPSAGAASLEGEPPMPVARAIDVLGRLVREQIEVLRTTAPMVCAAAGNPRHLHDLRVACRRLRAALRLFRPVLPAAAGDELGGALTTVNDALGPARDLDAWLARLAAAAPPRRLADDPRFRAYVQRLEEERRQRAGELRTILAPAACRQLDARIDGFLLDQCPGSAPDARPAAPFLARRLLRAWRRLRTWPDVAAISSPDALHDLRRRCRRVRYWAEFSMPLLPEARLDHLVVRLKAVTDALGAVHDVDVAKAHLRQLPDMPLPPALEKWLDDMRGNEVTRFRRNWKRLATAAFSRRLERELKAGANST